MFFDGLQSLYAHYMHIICTLYAHYMTSTGLDIAEFLFAVNATQDLLGLYTILD